MNWTKRSSEFFKSHLKPSSNGGWLLEIVVTKIGLAYCEKNCSSNREKLLTFEAEGREFEKTLRSLEQFVQTMKLRTIFGNIMIF